MVADCSAVDGAESAAERFWRANRMRCQRFQLFRVTPYLEVLVDVETEREVHDFCDPLYAKHDCSEARRCIGYGTEDEVLQLIHGREADEHKPSYAEV